MNDQLKDKLFNFEVAPPASLWDRVSEKLDEGSEPLWVDRVRRYELAPKPLWSRILQVLNQQQPAKVIPFHIRYRKPLKYSVTAAAIVILAIFTSLLINKSAMSEEGVTSPASVTAKKNAHQSSVETSHPSADNSSPSIASVYSNNAPFASRHRTQRINFLRLIEPIRPLRLSLPSVATQTSQVIEWRDHYTAYSTGDGEVVRLSKKMFDLVHCAAADIPCQEKLKAVRTRLSSSALTGNFGGLLDMLNSLSDNP